MKVHVTIDHPAMSVDEIFSGSNADEVVGAMKARVAKALPFTQRLAVSAASNLMFVQEVVKRYNANQQLNLPIPNSSEEFLQMAQTQGFATIVEA